MWCALDWNESAMWRSLDYLYSIEEIRSPAAGPVAVPLLATAPPAEHPVPCQCESENAVGTRCNRQTCHSW